MKVNKDLIKINEELGITLCKGISLQALQTLFTELQLLTTRWKVTKVWLQLSKQTTKNPRYKTRPLSVICEIVRQPLFVQTVAVAVAVGWLIVVQCHSPL